MSSRRRRAAEPAAEEEQQEEERDNEGLRFNEPLSWRAGRPIPTAELHKRLDTLAKELAELDQDWEHKDSLTKVAKELCSANILGHKDKGVKAYAACCMVDILKICAPDAPFTPTQLKVSRSSRRGDTCDGMLTRVIGYLRPLHQPDSTCLTRSVIDLEQSTSLRSHLPLRRPEHSPPRRDTQ